MASWFSCNCGEQEQELNTPWNVVVSSISLPKKVRPGAEISSVRLANSKEASLTGLPLLIFIVTAAVFVGVVVSGFTSKPETVVVKPSLW